MLFLSFQLSYINTLQPSSLGITINEETRVKDSFKHLSWNFISNFSYIIVLVVNTLFIKVLYYINKHCVKSVRIRSFSGPYFPAFGLNGEILRISPCSAQMRESADQKKTPYLDTFHAVESCLEFTLNKDHIKSYHYFDTV